MARAHPCPNPVEGDCLVVAEVADFRISLPAEVHGGCVLERATDAARPFLSHLIGSLLFWNANPFEVELDPKTKKPTPLPEDQWRYYYLRKADDYIPGCVLKASAIIEPSIYLGPRFSRIRGQSSIGSTPGIQNHYWDPYRWWNSGKTVTDRTISDWGKLASLLAGIESQYPKIGQSIDMFWILSGNDPTADRLTVLGYFTVIESLLTHKPDPKDPTDSIGRQIRSKMRLLGNRMASKLDYGDFKEKDDGNVWSSLYEYRSVLAHGDTPDFSRGKLLRLHSKQAVISFLQTACRRLLRQAVLEPLLCVDLKDC